MRQEESAGDGVQTIQVFAGTIVNAVSLPLQLTPSRVGSYLSAVSARIMFSDWPLPSLAFMLSFYSTLFTLLLLFSHHGLYVLLAGRMLHNHFKSYLWVEAALCLHCLSTRHAFARISTAFSVVSFVSSVGQIVLCHCFQ
jgi:hypothetical protein